MTNFEERMNDFVPEHLDNLICVDCKHRMPDSILETGKHIPQADNCQCNKFEDKPIAYMEGACPLYEKE